MKVILFDADGVLTLPEELFSVVYAKSHGLDPQPFEEFFKNEWSDIVTGKTDLKQSITANPDLWQWSGTADELVDYWCKIEDIRNDEMIDLVSRVRAAGTPCYLATEQEKYRGSYMKNVMFKDLFDGYFTTAALGVKKNNPEFFEKILAALNQKDSDIRPSDLLFFDDSQSKVDAAVAAGLQGVLFKSAAQVSTLLADAKIL